jgi:hypothetical protein
METSCVIYLKNDDPDNYPDGLEQLIITFG